MKTIVKKSLNYIQSRTCVAFFENATAPNRVRVFKGTGCWSNIGMIGGVQDLSLGNGCDVVRSLYYKISRKCSRILQVGIVAHEFSHTLGTFHTQMRSDRDDYVAIDLRNVPVDQRGNFAKLSTFNSINYTPYEYGSYMHYGSNTYETLLNRPAGCGEALVATTKWKAPAGRPIQVRVTYMNELKCGTGCRVNSIEPKVIPDKRITNPRYNFPSSISSFKGICCNDMLNYAPAGRPIQVRVTYMNELKCGTGCRVNSIEPKVIPDKRITNPRICCNDMMNYVVTSALNPTPIISYNRLLTTTFTFHYRYI
ncbi:unnamed protein product [Strongylus vulgaris]|uniref:Metalloendopeptidase n=1 Tax=Strongylus vulgaris TaxID=40348 RepID=A0A3P7LDT9_STRVU|nr:unnamed protein product [Strongylus vulgaris]